MPIVIPSSSPAVDAESLALDGLDIFAEPFYVESINFGLPASLAEWIKGADSNGAILSREPLHENRVIEVRMSVRQQATMDAAFAHIATLEDKLLECARNANGLPLVWSPAETTMDPITFRCLLGEVTEIPIDWPSGYFSKAPTVVVRLTCLPFGEGTEYLAGTVTSSAPIIPLELANIPGDVPALGRLVVTDAASQSRRYVAWGLESRWYNATTSLIIDAADMVTGAGYAGTPAAYPPAYGGMWIGAVLNPRVQAICGLGNLSHVGSFRPQLRCWFSQAGTITLRLVFQALDGPTQALSYKTPVAAEWNHLDLGLITIPETTQGTQRWTGRIEAYGAAGGETVGIEDIWLMPAEQYGKARATYAYQPGVMTAYDEFTGTTAGNSPNARIAPAGGTWTTSGTTTDFVFTDANYYGTPGEQVRRDTVSDGAPRYAILGATNYAAMEVAVDALMVESTNGQPGVIARWVDANNHLLFRSNLNGTLQVVRYVAGTGVTLATLRHTWRIGALHTLRVVVFASGRGVATLLDYPNGATLATLPFYDVELATGGALASGKGGFHDINTTAVASTRFYDNFYTATPGAEPIACYAGQSIEFRDDATLREDSTGVYSGYPPEYVGGRFRPPNAGGPARKTRVAVIARRNDVETAADDAVAGAAPSDSTTVAAYVTPLYLAVPRA